MRLVERTTLEVNKTVLVIGEVEEIYIGDASWVANDGKIDINAANTVCVSGLDEYHTTQSLGRLPYAKP